MPIIVYEKPSFQSLYVEVMCRGTVLSSATAFVAEVPGFGRALVTNAHVVTGRNFFTQECIDDKARLPDAIRVHHRALAIDHRPIPIEQPLYDDKGNELWISTSRAQADVVALPLPERDDITLLPYVFTNHAQFHTYPTDRVSILGFPFRAEGGRGSAVWAAGFVASQPNVMLDGKSAFLVDSRTRQGQSGSPVIKYEIDSQRRTKVEGGVQLHLATTVLLGIYSGRINKDSDLGTVWTADIVESLIVKGQGMLSHSTTSMHAPHSPFFPVAPS